MMHITNTVFTKIKSIHLIFTLYKRDRETHRRNKKPSEVMYWVYTVLITDWMCLVPAQLEQRENPQTNKQTHHHN